MKKIVGLLLAALLCSPVSAQVIDPVHWSVAPSGSQVEISARIDSPWHIYDLGPYTDGPLATSFRFELPKGVRLDGPIRQITPSERAIDPGFGIEVGTLAYAAKFVQKFQLDPGTQPVVIRGSVEWQACTDENCLAPSDYEFRFELTPPAPARETPAAAQTTPTAVSATPAIPDSNGVESDTTANAAAVRDTAAIEPAGQAATADSLSPENSEKKSLWGVIIEAILWGFAALLTPCVFPMVPMTVSFFLKGSENKRKGRAMASMYGLSIVSLYTLPIAAIILVTYFVGGDAVTADIFNWLATHWVPNVFFFLIFVLFAASFFGAFEITMPSWLVNKSDQKADKGGYIGVFFMALTLVLVSFSCTGPIVGTILVKSTQGDVWEPIFTMLAFSIAFALPFTLFAFFPALLKNLPKSGGWLNSVKVVLGFIELALGLKFLSVADQTYHWGILDREVYLALWIVIFALLGLYLLGKIRFAHDSETKYVSVKRLFMGISVLAFVVYLIPGMFGAPLKALSGYLPPLSTMDWTLTAPAAGSPEASSQKAAKYSDFLHLPHGLTGYFDYQEGLAAAREARKPVFIDFTGHGCVNCREMEANVWSDPRVLQILRDQYVIVALYVDDKKELPESEWVTTPEGKVQKTLGKINATFQIERFGVNAQPYYVLLDEQGNELVPPKSYDLNVENFIAFLNSGVEAYRTRP